MQFAIISYYKFKKKRNVYNIQPYNFTTFIGLENLLLVMKNYFNTLTLLGTANRPYILFYSLK